MIDIDVHKANYHNYSKKQLLRIIGELQDKTYRLEKALDKACNELDFLNCRLLDHCNKYNRVDANEWREWCMKVVE